MHEAVSCTTALVPFNKELQLDLTGLAAGVYEVTVNGFSLGSFTLDAEHACSTSCNWVPLHEPFLASSRQLNVPVVNTQGQVGAYHSLVFLPTQESGILQLLRADIGVQMQVLKAEVALSQSFPVQAKLTVSGQFSCYPPGLIEVRRQANVFELAVLRSVLPDTVEPNEVDCAQSLESFERTVALDIHDLDAGEYTIRVNGMDYGSFQLAQDNRLP